MESEERPGWKWNHYPIDRLDVADIWHLSGVLVRGWVLIGVVVKPNYPANDTCWPGRGGEVGIVLFNHLWGVWNDPGF